MDDLSLQRSAIVSRYWNKITIDAARQDQFIRIKQLAGLLQKSSPDLHLNKLTAIVHPSSILPCENLVKIRLNSQSNFDLFLDTLKQLPVQDLDHLETLSRPYLQPRFFENLFHLSKIYQKKERDYANKESKYKYHFLAIELMQQGYIERSFKVASLENSNYNFLVLANMFADKGDMKLALKATEKISNETIQIFAINQVLSTCYLFKNFLNPEAWKFGCLGLYQSNF